MGNRAIDLIAFGLLASTLPLSLIIPWLWLFVNSVIALALVLNVVILIVAGLLILNGNAEPTSKALSTQTPMAKLTSADYRPLPRYESSAGLKPRRERHLGVAGLEFDEHGNLI